MPYQAYRQAHLIKPERLHDGLDGWLQGFVGELSRFRKPSRQLHRQAFAIESSRQQLETTDDAELKNRLQAISRTLAKGQLETEDLTQALTLIAEAAYRTLGMRPYVPQIMGALGLCQGRLIEMGTGEGKSLTACLAAVVYAWSGRPFHLLTVNDYLSTRDAEAFEEFYQFCGVQVAAVTETMDDVERRQKYKAGVVYTTGKQLLADFLRDRLKLGTIHHPSRRLLRKSLVKADKPGQELVLRGIDSVIVDEADSILIDEAVSPLIISSPGQNDQLLQAVSTADQLAPLFEQDRDYKVDQQLRDLHFTHQGQQQLTQLALQLPGIWQAERRREELLKQALMARCFYIKGQHYIVDEQKVVIVDEYSGRLMANRSWGQGLHQAIEAKEKIPLTPPSETIARLSFQRFFRLFRRMAGMSGTAVEAAGECAKIYRLSALIIPPHKPSQLRHWPNQLCQNKDHKWQTILDSVVQLHEQQRPVLIGTRSVKDSEVLAALFRQRGLPYKLLNALNHEQEADIIATAGHLASITIATNMAGRGTDIELSEAASELGGLHVIISEKHESRRIDRQLAGRAARQGQAGSVQSYMCPDDELLRQYSRKTDRLTSLSWRINSAQKRAEDSASKQRKNTLQADQWMDESLLFGQRLGQV